MNLKDFLSKPFSIASVKFSKNKLNIIVGKPKVGKTAFLTFLAAESAKEKRPVLFITIDETKENIFYRVASNLSEVKMRDLKNSELKHQSKLQKIAEEFDKFLTIEGSVTDSLVEIKSYLEVAKSNGVETVLIDSINSIRGSSSFSERMNKAISSLINECQENLLTIIVSAKSDSSKNTPPYLLNKKAHKFDLWSIGGEDEVYLSDELNNNSLIFKFNKDFSSFKLKGNWIKHFTKQTSKGKILKWIEQKNYALVCTGLIHQLYPSAAMSSEELFATSSQPVDPTLNNGGQSDDSFIEGSTNHVLYYSASLNHAILYSSDFTIEAAQIFKSKFPNSKLTVFCPQDLSTKLESEASDLNINLVLKDQFKALSMSL